MRTVAKLLKRLVIALIVVAVAACAVVGASGYLMYRGALAEKSVAQAVEELRAQPGYTSVDDLPQVYLDAVVAVEDHRFYSHGGIDLIAIGRAAFNDLRTLSLAEGGSTITQQLAKNLFFSQEKRFTRKVAEVFAAFDLEAAYSKREILELYVNSSYFGDGYTGIGQAAPGYLGKAPAAMTDYESALMAGLPNAPSTFAANPDLAAQRQRIVVQQMEKYGFDPGTAATAAFDDAAGENGAASDALSVHTATEFGQD